MFEHIDLSKKMTKGEFKDQYPQLKDDLGWAQRELRDNKVPVMVVFEGWDAARMTEEVNQFLLPLDPRGYKYHSIGRPEGAEIDQPFMWRFWLRIPSQGSMVIFDRSWYSRALLETDRGTMEERMAEIKRFEKVLSDDGTLILKFFLHTSPSKVMKSKNSSEFEACGLIQESNGLSEDYEELLPQWQRLIEATDLPQAPWTIVEAEDDHYSVIKILRTAVERFKHRLDPSHQVDGVSHEMPALSSDRSGVDLSIKVKDSDYEEKLPKYQARMKDVQCTLFRKKKSMIVIFEGRDAAGKGGNIARLAQALNPRTYAVIPVTAPTAEEKARHYLWRFYRDIPLPGHLSIFDRSWYGRVLVERVEGFASEREWRRAYQEINDFEKSLVDNGSVIVKLWLEIDKKTQLERFIQRVEDPKKTWKITAEDWEAREKWDLYTRAADEMLVRTSTTYAPWTIVEANDKNFGRLKTLRTIIDAAKDL